MRCPACGNDDGVSVPPEPPVGTWVRDRFGATHQRGFSGWGTPGFHYLGVWSAMWEARGPLVECAPWGADE